MDSNANIVAIPVTKAANQTIDVDLSKLPEDVYLHALKLGLKQLLNGSMTKVASNKDLEGAALEENKAKAMAQAQKNLENIMAGKVRQGRATATDASGAKVSGVVMTEARRLAREVVRNQITALGMKVSRVAPSDITKIANEMIAKNSSFIEQAKENLAARSAMKPTIDIAGLISESPKLVEAAEKAKADRKAKAAMSAAQAGKVAKRKPAQPTA